MFGDGTGGLSIWSLKDPEHPLFVGALRVTDLLQPRRRARPRRHGDALLGRREHDVDSKRKLVYLARDPRSFGNNSHPNGRTGLYIIDVKDPWHPQILSYHWVPAGHTATCINDCRYLWSMGPANNGSHVNGQPQDIAGVLHPEWTGVPGLRHRRSRPAAPVHVRAAGGHEAEQRHDGLHAQRRRRPARDRLDVRLRRRPRVLHPAASHHDPVQDVDRYATATDPIPYAGGSVHSNDPNFATSILEHNSFHVTQARERPLRADGHRGGRARVPEDRPAVHHAGERDQLHVDERRRLRPLRGRQPRGHLRRRGLGSGRSPPRTASSSRRSATTRRRTTPARSRAGAARRTGSRCWATWSRSRSTRRASRVLDMSDPTVPTQVGYVRIPSATASSRAPEHLGRVLARRLHLHGRLQPRRRRPEVHRRDQGRGPAQGLLERLRQVDGRREAASRRLSPPASSPSYAFDRVG